VVQEALLTYVCLLLKIAALHKGVEVR